VLLCVSMQRPSAYGAAEAVDEKVTAPGPSLNDGSAYLATGAHGVTKMSGRLHYASREVLLGPVEEA
jgi:hypothetical protein